jgi:CheY-like chemotaxis protein
MILLVDDNEDILFSLKLILEKREFDVVTANSGENALNLLSTLETLPEVIVSDIMMPSMNGYEFFSIVSSNSQWYRIPFLFLTAKSTPDDIRLGKMLGVDDYITKPFNEEDLLASISGKIARTRKSSLMDEKIQQLLTSADIQMRPSATKEEKLPLCLLYVCWDDIGGPQLKLSHPSDDSCHFSISTIGKQLFHAATSIYGHDKITKAQSLLLNIENIKKKGYVFFDSYSAKKERYGEKQFMLSVIAPDISYFNSLLVRNVLKEISDKIKTKQKWEIIEYWEAIHEILYKSPLLKP